MNKVLLFYAALAIYAISCAKFKVPADVDLDPFIIGGTNIRINTTPYQASLMTGSGPTNDGHTCGASIISDRWLMCAAHCIRINPYDPYTKMYRVRVGSTYLSSGGVIYIIDKVVVHPKWDPNTVIYDYSLLRTWDKIIFTPTIQPIGLVGYNDVITQTAGYISGWGTYNYKDFNTSLAPKILQGADMIIQTNAYCKTTYGISLTETHLCVTSASLTSAICPGDSGGPVIRKSDNKLIGAASFVYTNLTTGRCLTNMPSVYSLLTFDRKWIFDTTQI